MSSFYQKLFRLSDTTLSYNNIYHPQTKDHMEVTNKNLEQYLRAFVMKDPIK